MYPNIDRFVSQLAWLDTLGDTLQQTVGNAIGSRGDLGRQAKDLLNGAWLGHPLHPAITDVPVGAWVTAAVMDVIGGGTRKQELEGAADLAVGVGLAAALGAASSGVVDWSDTYGKTRKVGLLHGLLMVATTGCYALSLLLRRSGHRKTGVALSDLGLLVLTSGAYLGGDEVFDLGYGVNHTAFEDPPKEFTPLMPAAHLEEGVPVKGEVNGVPVMVLQRGDDIYGLSDTCVHAGCSLAGGTVTDETIICPCHGSEYRLVDGTVVHGPATRPQPYYDARVRDGMVEIKLGVVL